MEAKRTVGLCRWHVTRGKNHAQRIVLEEHHEKGTQDKW